MDVVDNPTIVAVGGSGNLPATNELPVDMHSKLFTAFPALTPLLSILSRIGETNAKNFRIDWQEEGLIPTQLLVAGNLASGGTSLVVSANGDAVIEHSHLFNPRTFDLASVNSTGTAQAITITRSAGGTTEAAWVTGDVLHVLPPEIPENDSTFRRTSVADTNVFNFVQLIKMQYGITRTNDKITTHFGGPGSKRLQLKRQKWREFRTKWEKMIYFGGRATGGSAPATQRSMGGFVHYLRNGTLFKDFNGIFTETGFDNMLGDYHDQNPDATNIKYFTAGNVIRQINYFAKSKVRISPESKKFGLNILTYIGGPLTVDLIELPLMHDPQTRGWGFLLDMDRIMLKMLDKAAFFPDAETVGESEIITDTYRALASLLIGTESRHLMSVGALL